MVDDRGKLRDGIKANFENIWSIIKASLKDAKVLIKAYYGR
jgi:hypothetical protein